MIILITERLLGNSILKKYWTMKKLFSTIISFTVCLSMSGQQISQSNNRYRGNDALEKKQITVKGFDLNNKDGVWSLEDAEFSKATSTTEYTTLTDTLMAEERGNRTYYRQDRSAVSIIGSENVQELVSYDMPETWLRFPMQRGDSIIKRMAGDSARIREDIYRWYAEGYRYPVLEAKTTAYCGKRLMEETFYCPPEVQEQLVLDEENNMRRSST